MANEKGLVALIVKPIKGSDVPQLQIEETGEAVKDPVIMSDIIHLKHFGPDYSSGEGNESFRSRAIRERAPANANAYLFGGTSVERGCIGGSAYTFVMYLHIDDEQAARAPREIERERRHVEYDGSCDGDAD